jgi:hypothetical protein
MIDPALMMASSAPQWSIGHQAECQRPLWRRLVTRRGDVVYSDFYPAAETHCAPLAESVHHEMNPAEPHGIAELDGQTIGASR